MWWKKIEHLLYITITNDILTCSLLGKKYKQWQLHSRQLYPLPNYSFSGSLLTQTNFVKHTIATFLKQGNIACTYSIVTFDTPAFNNVCTTNTPSASIQDGYASYLLDESLNLYYNVTVLPEELFHYRLLTHTVHNRCLMLTTSFAMRIAAYQYLQKFRTITWPDNLSYESIDIYTHTVLKQTSLEPYLHIPASWSSTRLDSECLGALLSTGLL